MVPQIEVGACVPMDGSVPLNTAGTWVSTLQEYQVAGFWPLPCQNEQSTLLIIDQSHRYGRHQAACREPAGS